MLSLLQFHGVLDLHADEYGISILNRRGIQVNEDTGEVATIQQLRASGIFSDPNDFSLVLVTSILVSTDLPLSAAPFTRPVWLVTLAISSYAFALTKSRGGFLSLLAGIAVYAITRAGWKRALVAGVFALPLLLFVFSGRQTSINVSDQNDTAFGRVALWYEGIQQFKSSPLFGMGFGEFGERVGLVVHNSYVHSYTEMGFLGGTLFACAIGLPLMAMYRLRRGQSPDGAFELNSLQPVLFSVLAAYAVGIFSISRAYAIYTYLVLGVSTAFLCVAAEQVSGVIQPLNARLVRRMLVGSVALFLVIFVFVRVVFWMSGGSST